jgi:hemoglobin
MTLQALRSPWLWMALILVAAAIVALTTGTLTSPPPQSIDAPTSHRKTRKPMDQIERPVRSMYEQVGVPAIRVAVEQFYRRVLNDPACAGYFQHLTTDGLDRVRRHQALLIGQVLGGPVHFHDLGVLATVHQHLHITNDAYAVVVGHLLAVLYGLNVPSDIIKHLAGALEDVRGLVVYEPSLG